MAFTINKPANEIHILMTNLSQLPENLPKPIDDGMAKHLLGMRISSVKLKSTRDKWINLRELAGIIVVYCYPMTGEPGVSMPDNWDQIPGARGCTPQICSYKDQYKKLEKFGVTIFGLSTQSNTHQKKMSNRLHLPYEVLSDENLKFTNSMSLPIFEIAGAKLTKRLTMILKDASVVAVHYPVFPSDTDVDWVIEYLKSNGATVINF